MCTQNFSKENCCRLNAQLFSGEQQGKAVSLFILKNKNGLEMCISNYGAIVMAIMVPDKTGKKENVVLGHDSLQALIHSPEPYLGATIGRYGNRIAKGHFTLEGKSYNLAINNGPNNLHGGKEGFNRKVWEAHQLDNQTLELHSVSPDGEEGFPGTLNVRMTYQLTDQNEFRIDYEATTDKTTLVNLTNHAFFNLGGIGNPTPSIENNVLTIHADYYTPIDADSIPYGEIAPVADTPFDFRQPHTIGERIHQKEEQLIHGSGYDHNFVLNKKEAGELSFAAECYEPHSGRRMKVYTTEPGLQLYTGNWLNGFEGIHQATFPARSAVCFEAQHFPDTPNKAHFPSAVLHPGEVYRQTTIYAFSAE